MVYPAWQHLSRVSLRQVVIHITFLQETFYWAMLGIELGFFLYTEDVLCRLARDSFPKHLWGEDLLNKASL